MSAGMAFFLLPDYQNAKNKLPLHTPSFHISRNEHPLLASEFRTWHFSSCLPHEFVMICFFKPLNAAHACSRAENR